MVSVYAVSKMPASRNQGGMQGKEALFCHRKGIVPKGGIKNFGYFGTSVYFD
jgi:hypothetical protein